MAEGDEYGELGGEYGGEYGGAESEEGEKGGKGKGPYIDVQHYKFLGKVISFDDQKSCGWIQCVDTHAMWGGDVYIHKGVLDSARLQVGDDVRFGVHLNPKGRPQASLPVFKAGEDGLAVDTGSEIIRHPEEEAIGNPNFLDDLMHFIAKRSAQQNEKRGVKRGFEDDWGGKGWKGGKKGGGKGYKDDPYGGGKGKAKKGWEQDSWEGDGGGHKSDNAWEAGYAKAMQMLKGGGAPKAGINLVVSGVPPDATEREVSHIFRQYAGFESLRIVPKGRERMVFVTMGSHPEADFVCEALTGYVFDPEAQYPFTLRVRHEAPGGGGGKGGKKGYK